MVKVRISAAFERELRGVMAAPEKSPSLAKLAAKLIALVDEAKTRGEELGGSPGLSYQDVLRILGQELGPRLSLPPKPTAGWIVRLINRIKDLGLEEEHLRTIARRGAAEVAARTKNPGGPVEAEWLIWQSTRLLAGLDTRRVGVDDAPTGSPTVHTGRVAYPASAAPAGSGLGTTTYPPPKR